jgi:hypothetical protein
MKSHAKVLGHILESWCFSVIAPSFLSMDKSEQEQAALGWGREDEQLCMTCLEHL